MLGLYCLGGDYTQRETASGLPLESHGAANKRNPSMNKSVFDVTALVAHPCADSALFIIPDEHT